MNRLPFHSFIILLLLSLIGCTSKTVDKKDQPRNDSIKKYLDLAGDVNLDFEKREHYNDKAYSLLDLGKNDTLIRFYLSSLSYNYIRVNEFKKYKQIALPHFEKSISEKDTLNIARYYRFKAIYFSKTHIYDSAFYYLIKAEKFYKKTTDKKGLARVNIYKSNVQFILDDYLGAELSMDKAYLFYKKTENYARIANCLTNLGNIYHNLKQYDKAILYHKKALNLIIKNKVTSFPKEDNMAICFNNIGNSYREKRQFKTAIHYFKKGLAEKKLLFNDPESYGLLLNNLGYCYMKLNDNPKTYQLFEKAAKIFDSLGIKNNHIVSYIFLSEFYVKRGDTLKARKFAEKGLEIAKDANAPYYYLNALLHAGCADSKRASKYFKEYDKKNDSLLFIERNARNQYYKIQLETAEIVEEKETAIRQKWIIGIIAGVIILIIALLLIITRQRSRQKELQFQQSQQKANEEIYDLMLKQKNSEDNARQSEKKRIASELHDGVMNKLTSTRLNLNILSHQKDEKTISKCIGYIDDIQKIEQEIRSIAHNLNIEVFNATNSFAELLKDFIATQNETTSSHYYLENDITIDWTNMSSVIKMNLYRIIQEACHNVNKYAQATRVIISLILDEDNICLSITDNGKGFDTNANSEGIGLKNIKQRVESLRGKFVIQSDNKSTCINIAIPFVV